VQALSAPRLALPEERVVWSDAYPKIPIEEWEISEYSLWKFLGGMPAEPERIEKFHGILHSDFRMVTGISSSLHGLSPYCRSCAYAARKASQEANVIPRKPACGPAFHRWHCDYMLIHKRKFLLNFFKD